jgi:hypothetical protein
MRGETDDMTETLQVEAARIPDRDRLLDELRDAGLDAHALNEVGIEVRTADDSGDELLTQIESMIMSLGAPFVPIKHEDVIYIRPPLS